MEILEEEEEARRVRGENHGPDAPAEGEGNKRGRGDVRGEGVEGRGEGGEGREEREPTLVS